MENREKVIKGLEQIINDPFMKARADYWVLVCSEAIAMLKEQDETIKELQNAYGYLQKQFFEAQDELLKEQEAVVRCKDCRHYNIIGCAGGFGWCERYDVGHTDEWFCADGKKGKK